jgi:hypothetical protein
VQPENSLLCERAEVPVRGLLGSGLSGFWYVAAAWKAPWPSGSSPWPITSAALPVSDAGTDATDAAARPVIDPNCSRMSAGSQLFRCSWVLLDCPFLEQMNGVFCVRIFQLDCCLFRLRRNMLGHIEFLSGDTTTYVHYVATDRLEIELFPPCGWSPVHGAFIVYRFKIDSSALFSFAFFAAFPNALSGEKAKLDRAKCKELCTLVCWVATDQSCMGRRLNTREAGRFC